METNTKQEEKINFRAVTISDLDRIKKLYYKENPIVSKDQILEANHFGLPIHIAELNSQIVAYTYVSTNEQSKNLFLQILMNPTVSNEQVEEQLKQYSEQLFKTEWSTHADNNTIIHSIHQFINWINLSNS